MKPKLVIGLGSRLMGDDGAGAAVAERLAGDARLPGDAEVLHGGTDLLRYADQMEGRRRVIIVDALLDGLAPGRIAVHNQLSDLDQCHRHAHHLSAPGVIAILRAVSVEHARTEFVFVAISIASVEPGAGLSPVLEKSLPSALDCVLVELQR